MTVTMLAGCGGAAKTDDSSTSSTTETTTESSDTPGDSTTEEAKTSYSEDEISDLIVGLITVSYLTPPVPLNLYVA